MSFNLQGYGHAAARIDGETIVLGSLERPISISVTGNIHRRTETIANGANAVIYADELGDFVFLYISSDYTTRVKLTDTGGSTFHLPLKGTGTANKQGLPIMLGDDSTLNSNVSINAVQVFNESGSSAKVTLVIVE